jgi:hypothetical protein
MVQEQDGLDGLTVDRDNGFRCLANLTTINNNFLIQ